MKWYQEAADQGSVVAQTNIGLLYAKGFGVKQDYSEAMTWYLKAGPEKNANAQFCIELCMPMDLEYRSITKRR